MRIFLAAAVVALLAPSVYAQNATPEVPKTAQEIEADRAAERAYKKSLTNIPDHAPTDPWGIVRSEKVSDPKAVPPKPTKAGNAGK